jgi:hypothetical protein
MHPVPFGEQEIIVVGNDPTSSPEFDRFQATILPGQRVDQVNHGLSAPPANVDMRRRVVAEIYLDMITADPK